MKHSFAAKISRDLLWGVQKVRSDLAEAFGCDLAFLDTNDFHVSMHKWVLGRHSTIHSLSKLIERVDNGGQIAAMELYNQLYIATVLQPVLSAITVFHRPEPFPELHEVMACFDGWESESDS